MAYLFGPYAPTTGTLIEIDIPQDSAEVEVENSSPFDLWASFSPQAPVTGRTIATGFYGQMVRKFSSKVITVPDPDVNQSNRGALWLYPFNADSPGSVGSPAGATIYAITSATAGELRSDSGVGQQDTIYCPTQGFAHLAGVFAGHDSAGIPTAYSGVALPVDPQIQGISVTASTSISSVTLTGPTAVAATTYLIGFIATMNANATATQLQVQYNNLLSSPSSDFFLFTQIAGQPAAFNPAFPPWAATGVNIAPTLTFATQGGGNFPASGRLIAWFTIRTPR